MMESAIAGEVSPPEHRLKWDVFLVALLAVSLGLNVFLGWKLKGNQNKGILPAASLNQDAEVSNFEAYDLSDKLTTITCRGQITVLYVFSPSCTWCERNLENIRTLASARGDSYRFIGLSLASANLEDYIRSSKLSFPVYTKLSKDVLQKLKLGSTPQTMVISPEGRVMKNWRGAYGEELRSEIEEFFSVRLPGLDSRFGQTDKADSLCPEGN